MNILLKASLIVFGIASVVSVAFAEQEVPGVALEDSPEWLMKSLSSAVQTGVMSSVAANTYMKAVKDGAVSRAALLNGLAADYGIGGPAISFMPTTPVAAAEIEMPELAKKSNCTACHAINTTVVGPAWYDVALRYKGDASAETKLVNKVANGGAGVWGDMPEIPNSRKVSSRDINTLVKFVLSLNPPAGYVPSGVAMKSSRNTGTKPFNEKTLLEGLSGLPSNQGKRGTSPVEVPVTSAKPTAIEDSIPQRLRELKVLKDEGLITESEFQEKKRRLLEQY